MIRTRKFRVPVGLLTLFLVLFSTISADNRRYINLQFPNFNKVWINPFQNERSGYFEGDIMIRNSPIGDDLKAGSFSARWKEGVIPYTFASNINVSGRKAILAAMRDIQTKTCIRFKYRRNRKPEKDYVFITMQNDGCYSYVGRDGGAQQLNLGPGCWHKTTIIHELVHAVGFWHEQSRLDRDKFVSIQWNNISPVFRREFSKHSRLNNFGTDYDYRSVMHYSFNAFSKNRRATIVPKANYPWRLLGTGDEFGGLTVTDALQINKMYNCTSSDNFSKLLNE